MSVMTKERFQRTSYKMSYAEHRCCDCQGCTRSECKHREAYRRVPKIDGGLALCPNLMFSTIILEDGVLVERNGQITTYRSKEHAITELENKAGCEGIVQQLKSGMVYCTGYDKQLQSNHLADKLRHEIPYTVEKIED